MLSTEMNDNYRKKLPAIIQRYTLAGAGVLIAIGLYFSDVYAESHLSVSQIN